MWFGVAWHLEDVRRLGSGMDSIALRRTSGGLAQTEELLVCERLRGLRQSLLCLAGAVDTVVVPAQSCQLGDFEMAYGWCYLSGLHYCAPSPWQFGRRDLRRQRYSEGSAADYPWLR